MEIAVGMVGGGPGSFIGETHRHALRYDGRFKLQAGAFTRSVETNDEFGETLGIDAARRYGSWRDLLAEEVRRDDGIEAVIIATPNDTHHEIAAAALDAGLHVMCDKPVAVSLRQALDLRDRQRRSGRVFALTHNYTGYAMVRQAREMVRDGALGEIRIVQVEFAQGWASAPLEQSGHKQAEWRMDPVRVGPSAVLMDLGTHAHHLMRFVTGCEVEALCTDLRSFVPGRATNDDAHLLMRLTGGASGQLWASMVANGNGHGLRLRVYGDAGSLAWKQEIPNRLIYRREGEPDQVLSKGNDYLSETSRAASRVGGGHPGGFIEAFANLYREFADAIEASKRGETSADGPWLFPTVDDGVAGLAFVEAAIRSHQDSGNWISLNGEGDT